MKTLLTYIFIGYTAIALSQNVAQRQLTFGQGPDCRGNQGICSFSAAGKTIANTQLSYDAKNNLLILVIAKTDTASKLKLTQNKLEDTLYLYNFDENYDLPDDILNLLGITGKTKIKKGNYLVKDAGDILIMKLKLE